MEEKLQELLSLSGVAPDWSYLIEEMTGQADNYFNKIGDYSIFEEYRPKAKEFTMDDFMRARRVEDIPEDWLAYAYACMEKIGL